MGMSIDTVNQWLKIQRQNLKDFPEIASDKKIESLDTAISYLEDYKQLLHKYLKDIKKALENGIDNLPTATSEGFAEAIPKDEYEARLKADKIAMLKELDKELEEVKCNPLDTIHDDIAEEYFNLGKIKGLYLIQQKINELTGENNNETHD